MVSLIEMPSMLVVWALHPPEKIRDGDQVIR